MPKSDDNQQQAQPTAQDDAVKQQLADITNRLNSYENAVVQQQPPPQAPPPPQQEALTPPERPVPEEGEDIATYDAKIRQYEAERNAYEQKVAERQRQADEAKAQQDAYNKQVEHIRKYFAANPEAKKHLDELRPLVNEKGYSIEDAWDLVRLRKTEAEAKEAAKVTAGRRSPIKASEAQKSDILTRSFENTSDAIFAAIDAEIEQSGRLEDLPNAS